MNDMSIKKAAIINIMGKYSTVIINLIYTIILSRILTPSEFGVFAVVSVFVSFFALIANIGLGPSIIQNKELIQKDYNILFTFTIIFAIFIGAVFAILSYPISIFYQNDTYLSIVMLLSVSLFFNTINIVPESVIRKKQEFKKLAFRDIFVSIISAIFTIGLAIYGWSYYSLVMHSIIIAFLKCLWNYYDVKLKIEFKNMKKTFFKVKEFSSNQFIFSIINYFAKNLDNLLIGKYIGESQLGYYNRSYTLMKYPVQYLTHAITPVLHPILSKEVSTNSIFLKYSKIVKMLSLLGVFITVFTFLNTEELILVMYGKQWLGSVQSMKYLTLAIWSQMLVASSWSIFQSLNKTKLMVKSSVITTFITIAAIVIGILKGNINDVALYVSISYNIMFIIVFYLLIVVGMQEKYSDFLKFFRVDFINFILLLLLSYIFKNYIKIDNTFLSLFINFLVTCVIYFLLLIISKQHRLFTIFISKQVDI